MAILWPVSAAVTTAFAAVIAAIRQGDKLIIVVLAVQGRKLPALQ